MIELGEHCQTRIIPRLRKVIDGKDGGGVSESVGWEGGGGFRCYRLAPSLIVNDRWGNPVINPEYNAAQLAEALAKLEGFNCAPSEVQWWQQKMMAALYDVTVPAINQHLKRVFADGEL